MVAATVPSSAFARQRGGYDTAWEIGPVIRGRNYSVGMPPHPTATRNGWAFDFPGPRRSDGHVHYVTRATGPLDGARGIRVRYRVDARRGTRFIPQETPNLAPKVSLFIQARGDDWNARRGSEFDRWYSPHGREYTLEPGVHEITIMFDENWIAVMGSDRNRAPREFLRTLQNASRVGLTFGSSSRRGHGIFATGPARFELLEFSLI